MAARTDRPTNKLHKMNRRPTDEKRPDGASFNGQSSTSVRQRRHFWIIFFSRRTGFFYRREIWSNFSKNDSISGKQKLFFFCVCVSLCVTPTTWRVIRNDSTAALLLFPASLFFSRCVFARRRMQMSRSVTATPKKKKNWRKFFPMKLNWILSESAVEGGRGGADRISRRPIIGVGVAGDNLSTYGRRVAGN